MNRARTLRAEALRLPLAVAFVVGGSLMMAPQAHAEPGWELSYSVDGTAATKTGGSASWSQYLPGYDPSTGRFMWDQNSMQFHKESGDIGSVLGGSEPSYRSSLASLKGSITFHLKWVQGVGEDDEDQNPPFVPAPKVVRLHIRGNASAWTGASTGQSTVAATFGKTQGVESLIKASTGGQARLQRWTLASRYDPDIITIPLSVPEGESEVEYTFPLEAKATTEQIDYLSSYSDADVPYSDVGVFISAESVDNGVAITSDIETSWKKFTGAAVDLPDVCKKRDPISRDLINEPNAKAVLVSPDTTDPSKSIWKIACLRDGDGKMTVESAAQWMKSSDGYFKAWLGGSRFTVQTAGFNGPTSYEWTEPSNSQSRSIGTPTAVDDLSPLPPMGGGTFYGIKLGSENGSDLTSSSTIKVKVTDLNNSFSLSDSYAVNWHLPVENRKCIWNDDGKILNQYEDGKPASPDFAPLSSNGGSSAISVGAAFGDYPDLTKQIGFNYGKAAYLAGSTVTATTAAGSAASWYLVGGAINPYVAAGAAVLAAGLSITGTILGSSVPVPKEPTPSEKSNYSAYKSAVLAQKNEGDYKFGHLNSRFVGNIPVAIAAQVSGNEFVDSAGNRDTVAGRVQVTGDVVFDQIARRFQWDEYDAHGYTGQDDIHEVKHDAPKWEITFTDPNTSGNPGGQ